MSPYIAHNDMAAPLPFIWFPDSLGLMSVGDISPPLTFHLFHSSTFFEAFFSKELILTKIQQKIRAVAKYKTSIIYKIWLLTYVNIL